MSEEQLEQIKEMGNKLRNTLLHSVVLERNINKFPRDWTS